MNQFPFFNPPSLKNAIHLHIDEAQEAINNTTIQGPAPVVSIDPSQGSFAQISESPDDNFVVNIVQYKTQTTHLQDCVTSYFTREQRMEHRGTANAISHFDSTTDHALCVGEIATQRRRQKLSVKYHSHSRKHPRKHRHQDI